MFDDKINLVYLDKVEPGLKLKFYAENILQEDCMLVFIKIENLKHENKIS